MNPQLLALLARFGPRALSGARTGLFGLEPAMRDNLPAQALERIQSHQDAQNGTPSPQKRIMDAFEHYKQNKPVSTQQADRQTLSPQERIDQAFGVPGMAFPPMQQQAPQVAQPMQQLPLPAGERKFTELPGRNPTPPDAAQPPLAPEIPNWFQRNGMLQRDPETGAFLDPAMAQRAQAMGGMFG